MFYVFLGVVAAIAVAADAVAAVADIAAIVFRLFLFLFHEYISALISAK